MLETWSVCASVCVCVCVCERERDRESERENYEDECVEVVKEY